MHVVLLILAGLATSALPLPWQVASLGFTLTAIVVGIRALRRIRRPGRRDPISPLLVFGLMFAVLMTLSTVGTLMLWPVQMARQECLSTAVTISAREQCEADYEAGLRDRLQQLTSRP